MSKMLYELSDREAELVGRALEFYSLIYPRIREPLTMTETIELADLVTRWMEN